MARKSILISYFFGDDMIPLGVSCANAFRDLGYDVHCFNSQVESPWEPVVMKPMHRLARALGYRRLSGAGGLWTCSSEFYKAAESGGKRIQHPGGFFRC